MKKVDFVKRSIEKKDLPAILEANQSGVPEVGSLNKEELGFLIQESCSACLYETYQASRQHLVGFVIVIPENSTYKSLNYKWFSERYNKFLYIDRVWVSAEFRGQGYGRKIYEDLKSMSQTEKLPLLAEVNLEPLNFQSISFHRALGFKEVGEGHFENKAVSKVCYFSYNEAP
jgi:predicted GNAT superfamily acetyltransferase